MMSAWVTEKKPPLFLIGLLGLQLLAGGLLGVLLIFSSLTAGTQAQNYAFTSGLTLLFTVVVLGLPGVFFLRRSTNMLGGGGLTLILQLIFGYWGYSGPVIAFLMMGSEGESLYSSYFVMGGMTIFITGTIVVLRVLKEDRDYVSKLFNLWPSLILTFVLRFPAFYSFLDRNVPDWPIELDLPVLLLGFVIYWINFEHVFYFIVFYAGIYILRSFQDKIIQWLDSGIATNFYNVIPTLIILFLVMGTSVLESMQFGATRHRLSSDLPEYIPQNIDFDPWNTSFWDADFILNSLLDQFTSGLTLPDLPLFNITECDKGTTTPTGLPLDHPDSHVAYWWRKEVYSNYGYEKNPSATFGRSAWDVMPVEYRDFGNTTYGQNPTDINATFRIDYLANKAEDQTLWQGYIPATWNGPTGSKVTSIAGNAMVQEASPDGVSNDYRDSLGIWATASVPAGTESDTLTYYTDFKFNALDLLNASIGADYRDSYYYISAIMKQYGLENATATNLWNTIKQAYLQIPDTTGVNLPAGENSYADWAPVTDAWADDTNNPSFNVYQQARSTMVSISPDPATVQAGLGDVLEGEEMEEGEGGEFTFDWEAWLMAQYGTDPKPGEDEDYVEWFLERKKGVAAHFATALTILLRLQGIPSRFVYGYLVGNTTYGDGNLPYTVMTARWQHAWTEVLIPITNPLNPESKYLEWVVFDPLFASLFPDLTGGFTNEELEAFAQEPVKFVNPYTINDHPILYPKTLQASERRIGLATASGVPLLNTTGLVTNFPELQALFAEGYVQNIEDPEILCNNPSNPTNTTVIVQAVKNELPIRIEDILIYQPPPPIAGASLSFYLFKNEESQKVKLNNTATGEQQYYIYATTNATGHAEFTFQYDLTQGLGDAYFYVDVIDIPDYYNINMTDTIVAGISDAAPFNTVNGATNISTREGYDPYTMNFGSPPALLNELRNDKVVNNKESSSKFMTIDQLNDVYTSKLESMAAKFESGFEQQYNEIVDYTNDLILSNSKKSTSDWKTDHPEKIFFDDDTSQLDYLECFLRKKNEGIEFKVLCLVVKQ